MKIGKTKVLSLILIILICNIFIMETTKAIKKTDYYDDQIKASEMMSLMTRRIKEYKIELGLDIYEYDYHDTGLLGDDTSKITTSLGNLEAKRSTTNPDMAALVLRLFKEAGLKKGDKIGVGLSGSFPGANIAVLAASEVMDLDLIIISSVGSSNYGANQPNLSFPKMLYLLNKEGFTKYNSELVTIGGDNDAGEGIDKEALDYILNEYYDYGLNVMIEPDFNTNLEKKIEFYNSINGYVAVGGNISFLGISQKDISSRYGLLNKDIVRKHDFNEKDGLLDYYLSLEIPTIHILNIKKIFADYNMEYDPVDLKIIGESNVYYQYKYNKIPTIVSGLLIICLIYKNKEVFKTENKRKK